MITTINEWRKTNEGTMQDDYSNIDQDDDGNTIGCCRHCGSNGVLVHEHDKTCKALTQNFSKPEIDNMESKWVETIWNSMSYDQKEELFADEFDKFFDASDNYQKNIADIMFNSKWIDLDISEQNRIKEILTKENITKESLSDKLSDNIEQKIEVWFNQLKSIPSNLLTITGAAAIDKSAKYKDQSKDAKKLLKAHYKGTGYADTIDEATKPAEDKDERSNLDDLLYVGNFEV